MQNTKIIEDAYNAARNRYAVLDVDTDAALKTLETISLSVHCWQGDDVAGFEKPGGQLEDGGIQVTGNYPGRARNIDELRMDLEKAYSLIPGNHRLNLHAIYGEFGGKSIDRNEIAPEHFRGWIDWSRDRDLKLDFNATCFSHPLAKSGFTLSSADTAVRNFWIEHVKRCRTISAFMGHALGSPCIHDIWIPDGAKNAPVDRWKYRTLLRESLDKIFETEYSPSGMKDALESKLFGIGSESFVVGSNEFYLAYALANKKMLCLDLGHFHPTESVADKLSGIMQFSEELLLHISRGVRWDSDHVVILNDEIRSVTEEIVRGDVLERVHIALDYFDASMNRVGAWVIGARAVLKAFLIALLLPCAKLNEAEGSGNNFEAMAIVESSKTMPASSVWDYYCLIKDVPGSEAWISEVQQYDKEVLSKR